MVRRIKKGKQFFDSLVFACVGRDDAEAVRKMSLMFSLAAVGIIVLILLGIIALFQNAVILGVIDFLTVLFLISLLTFTRFSGNYIISCYLACILMASLYLYVFVTGGVDSTGFVWYYTYPLIALFLMGAKAGTIATILLFIPAVIFLVVDCRSTIVDVYTTNFALRFIPSFITVFLFSFMYEKNREGSQKSLEKAYKEQDLVIESRTRELAELNQNLQQIVDEKTNEIKATQRQLVQAEKLSAIGTLVASIAHEFNNPLCGVTNVLNRIQRKNAPDDSNKALLTMAIAECDRMKRLIQDLQSFNRPTSGVKEKFDLHKSINEILLLFKKELSINNITVIRKFGEKSIWVIGVEDQIKQVVLNLLKNSKEAIQSLNGIITISTELIKDDKECLISIQDTGAGIEKKDMESIFEPFFTTKPAVKGTGLGLSVSHGIISGHGGELRVESEPGTGTTFCFNLQV
jgi:C4-dicarboxylate-specific signal transduction histidine kinase